MSSLAALLLTYLNEEDAFWGMVTLIGDQKYAMHGKFDEHFYFIHVFLFKLSGLLLVT